MCNSKAKTAVMRKEIAWKDTLGAMDKILKKKLIKRKREEYMQISE